MRPCLFAILICAFASPVLALEMDGTSKFQIDDTTLIYDTEITIEGDEAEITNTDVDRLLKLLRGNPQITQLELNSSGGSVFAGNEMARIVIDFELDTLVSGECSSSCVTIFLGGTSRRMLLGSKIGFHQRQWPADAMESYYTRWSDDSGWNTPFDFASWVYEDTQSEMHTELMYLIERGVDPVFAIKTKGVLNADEWFPSRLELTRAGVLRE
ncbi:hypothetical protein [Falsiphaeobacter marinintestinus]|uniref:COG3904 family protein n=1 Tax=Falsiphaeobacter marinintestinus TaxID=1492905 RepID=UPI001FE2E354|nr:hypothetical protein [Phaeobacter marinintestinus]